METFVYKCPNCGGKTSYIDNKWHCEYCGNQYDALFKTEKEETLPQYNNEPITLYCYHCASCNHRVISSEENGANCSKCGAFTAEGKKPLVVSGVIDLTLTKTEAEIELRKEAKKYDQQLFNYDLKLQYFNCDLYNGFVKISYDNISEKFFFVNLLIPNIEYEDYRFMYEVGNIGITDIMTLNENKDNNTSSSIILHADDINNLNDFNYEQDIVNECIKSFARKNKVNDIQSLTIEKNFKISDGIFIPMYVSESTVDGTVYRHYVYGNRKICKYKKNIFNATVQDRTIIELPSVPNARKKAKLSYFLSSISPKTFVILLFIFFYAISDTIGASVQDPKTSNFAKKVCIADFILAVILLIINFVYHNKYNYYEKAIKMNKEDYFDQIINNSNYVKIINVRSFKSAQFIKVNK